MFTDSDLLDIAGRVVFKRGQEYFSTGKVILTSAYENGGFFIVHGTRTYRVQILIEGGRFHGDCNCPHADRGFFCKHQVAAALFFRERDGKNRTLRWKTTLQNVVAPDAAKPRKKKQKQHLLFFSLLSSYDGWMMRSYTIATSHFPKDTSPELFQRENAVQLQEYIAKNNWIALQAKPLSAALNAKKCINAHPSEAALAQLIRKTSQMASRYYYYSYADTNAVEQHLTLLASYGTPVWGGDEENPFSAPLQILTELANLNLHLSRNEEFVTLQTRLQVGDQNFVLRPDATAIINDDPIWVLVDNNKVIALDEQLTPEIASTFLEEPITIIPIALETEFIEGFLVPLANRVPIEGEKLIWQDVREQPQKRIYLSEEDGELLVQLRFGYGDYEVTFDKSLPPLSTKHMQDGSWTLLRIYRDPAFEQEVYGSISSARYGLKYANKFDDPNGFVLRAKTTPVDFLLKKVSNLAKDGFAIYGEETLLSVRVNRNAPTISLNVSSGIDWFDINAIVSFGDATASLQDLRRALRKKERFIKLTDGSIGELPDEWITKYKHLFALGETTEEGIRLSQHHLSLIDQLLNDVDTSKVDKAYKQRLKKLKDFSSIKSQLLPEGFRGELRPYQKAGFDWLHFLHEYNFGGCLADDMGLGKTVQVLTFLQSLKETQPSAQPSLVIVPRSLLINWQREVEKFTPSLKVMVQFGPARQKDNIDFGDADIILTTYGTMRRDIQMLREYEFNYVIMDESQAIKNPGSQVSKASRLLRARHRLVMTGTPVENSTFELWAQFTFLNPGLLGNLEYFKREFAKPIERDQDQAAAAFLKDLVYPFILRRTKDKVAPELPPRTERILYADMEAAQKKTYARTKEYYRSSLLGLIEDAGVDNARMKILEGLLRLRQICNHPKLVDNKFKGSSAKMEMLMENLRTLRAEGHKVLVFSQFVQMLKIIEKELKQEKIPYAYLDGSTTKRQDKVDEFQNNPDIPFFLISLRAGGVGLNLTAADYVIHVDPWWNPAVEMQATDRTHRIGQDKPVFVYKLIVRDSIEEKILQLQEKKKALVDQLITTESSFFKTLTPEDVQVLFS